MSIYNRGGAAIYIYSITYNRGGAAYICRYITAVVPRYTYIYSITSVACVIECLDPRGLHTLLSGILSGITLISKRAMDALFLHLDGLKRLLTMSSGVANRRVQEGQVRVLEQKLHEIDVMNMEDACRLVDKVKDVGLAPEIQETVLQNIFAALEQKKDKQKHRKGQQWENLAIFLQKKHWDALLNPQATMGNLENLANFILMFLMNMGLRSPSEPTMGMITALIAYHDVARRQDPLSLRGGLLQLKKQWLTLVAAAPQSPFPYMNKLPDSPSDLPREMVEALYGPDLPPRPPVDLVILGQLAHLVPLRKTKHSLEEVGNWLQVRQPSRPFARLEDSQESSGSQASFHGQQLALPQQSLVPDGQQGALATSRAFGFASSPSFGRAFSEGGSACFCFSWCAAFSSGSGICGGKERRPSSGRC